MIKLNLSDGLDIQNYNPELKLNKLYLGYIKGRGYILINERNGQAYFKCIESDKEPDYLNDNWTIPNYDNKTGKWIDEPKEIAFLYNQLDLILKDYIDKTLNGVKGDYIDKIVNDVFVKIVAELLESVSDKFISYDYAKVGNIGNEQIKNLALEPTKQFNSHLNAEPKKIVDVKKETEKIENKIANHLAKAIKIYNKQKGLQSYTLETTGEEITKELIDEKKFIKILNEIVSNAFTNPLLNLYYSNGKNKTNIIQAVNYLIEEFNIKGVFKNNTEKKYFYNYELNYFEELTENKLKNLIIKNFEIIILQSDYRNIFNAIPTIDKEYTNLLVFKNMLFDMDRMEELNFPVCEYNRADFLAPALIGFENDNNQIQLLNYDDDFDFMELYNSNPDPNEMTFTEKTLRQILIPKDEPNNLQMFHDFLQRLGSCILGRNQWKTITLYYGDGNNGKSVLKLLFELIFNLGAYSLTPATFEDKFKLKSFIGRKVILIDELMKNSFKGYTDELKRMSSPIARTEQRGFLTDENIIINHYPNIFLFSNVLIHIPLSEPALFDRVDFLKLPNVFVTEKEMNKTPNSYLKDRNTENKLKNDVKGLSWLITASIKFFIKMQENKSEYLLKQTANQTMEILAGTDHLTKFISLYTEIDLNLVGSECTTNEEILQQYKQYLELMGAVTTETDKTIKRRIGTTLKQVYDIEGNIKNSEIYHKQNNTLASYKIRIKSFDELNKEFSIVYLINDDVTDVELMALDYSTENKIVYDKIQNGTNTINLLNKALPNYDNYKIVRELLNLNLIIKTTEINLTEVN